MEGRKRPACIGGVISAHVTKPEREGRLDSLKDSTLVISGSLPPRELERHGFRFVGLLCTTVEKCIAIFSKGFAILHTSLDKVNFRHKSISGAKLNYFARFGPQGRSLSRLLLYSGM
jgi:hypothetical protein